jgi:hypothetical protein
MLFKRNSELSKVFLGDALDMRAMGKVSEIRATRSAAPAVSIQQGYYKRESGAWLDGTFVLVNAKVYVKR